MTLSWQLWGKEQKGQGRNRVSGWARPGEEVGLWWGKGGIKGGDGLSLGGFLTGRKTVEKKKNLPSMSLASCCHFLK